MKNKIFYFFLLMLIYIFTLIVPVGAAPELGKCTDCHSDIKEVLPKGHKNTKAADISSCMTCHKASKSFNEPHPFSAGIHRAHLKGNPKLDCSFCHIIEADKSFSLPKRKSIGEPDKDTIETLPELGELWADSPYLGTVHANKDIMCSSCHGEELPLLDARPTNDSCLVCHESYAALAAKTPGKDHPSRNPHNSHLGPINCRICHKAHTASVNYCFECHKRFNMNPIPTGK